MIVWTRFLIWFHSKQRLVWNLEAKQNSQQFSSRDNNQILMFHCCSYQRRQQRRLQIKSVSSRVDFADGVFSLSLPNSFGVYHHIVTVPHLETRPCSDVWVSSDVTIYRWRQPVVGILLLSSESSPYSSSLSWTRRSSQWRPLPCCSYCCEFSLSWMYFILYPI